MEPNEPQISVFRHRLRLRTGNVGANVTGFVAHSVLNANILGLITSDEAVIAGQTGIALLSVSQLGPF